MDVNTFFIFIISRQGRVGKFIDDYKYSMQEWLFAGMP